MPPRMKLDFLKNPHQRVATGKSLPLRQVEAIVLYGRPEQKAKVIEKVLPATYSLSLSDQTSHILLTLLDTTDALTRVKMLYEVRGKVLDLCNSACGNKVLQKMIESVPARNRREVAETFILNVEEDEFKRLCENGFGNHVAQKFLEYPECAAVLCAQGLVPYIAALSTHQYGMRVVAKYVETVEGGWKQTLRALFPGTPLDELDESDNSTDNLPRTEAYLTEAISASIDDGVRRLFASENDTMVIAALLKSIMVPTAFKDAIVAHLAEYASEYINPQPREEEEDNEGEEKKAQDELAAPDFGSAATAASGAPAKKSVAAALKPRHAHAYVAAFEQCDDAQRKELWEAFAADTALLAKITDQRQTSSIAAAAAKNFEPSRAALYAALFEAEAKEAVAGETPAKKRKGAAAAKLSIAEVVENPVRTMVLRTFMEVDPARVTKAQRAELAKDALRLAQHPTASPSLTSFMESDPTHAAAAAIYKATKKALPELVGHVVGAFLVQGMLQFSDEDTRAALAKDLWEILGANLRETLAYAQGSRVMQKLLAYAPDEVVVNIVDQIVETATEEAEAAAEANLDEEDDAASEEADDEKEDGADKGAEPAKPLSRKAILEANRKKHYGIRSNALADYALSSAACWVIQALLRETRSRQLERERKMLMDELKPFVFELSVSPWAGRRVLEAMMQVGSAQLSNAMKNVVFLKAEEWLSDVSDAKKRKGAGIDATTRDTLKRQRQMNSRDDGERRQRAVEK